MRRRWYLDGTGDRLFALAATAITLLAIGMALGGCTAAQLARVEPALQMACDEAMRLAPLASLVPEAGAVVPFVLVGCGTVEGLARLAADPSSAQWVSQQIGMLKTLAARGVTQAGAR